MKRSLFGKTFKQTFLAIPASALMLGAVQAQTSVGINFQGNYGGSYSGAPVTVTDFGVPAGQWFTASDAASGSLAAAGSLNVSWSAANTWCSGLYPDIVGSTAPNPLPGNGEVLWGYLDDGAPGYSVSVSGLASVFTNGYVIQTIGANSGAATFAGSIITDGTTTFTNAYSNYWYPQNFFGPPFTGTGTAALSSQSTVFTNDSVTISGMPRSGSVRAPLCGFIVTDKPVVSFSPVGVTNVQGSPVSLSVAAIGIPPLSYQWQLNGTNIPGATFVSYTNLSAGTSAAGNYQLIITNLYGTATSQVAAVGVLVPASMAWVGNVNGTWDINTTANWTTNGVATSYVDGSFVTFGDTAANTGVNVATTVSPYTITVTNNTKTYTIGGSAIASAPGGLIKGGTNALTLSGANTFTGPITINGGSLTIADPGVLGGGKYSGAITNNGSFIWASSANQTNTAAMTGSGSVTLNGSGTLTMTADMPVTGGITANSGTLQVAVGNFGGTFTPSLIINTNATVIGINTHALGGGTSLFINRGTWLLNNEDYKQNLAMVDGLIGTYAGNGDGGSVRVGNSGGTGNWTWYVSNSIAGSVINEPLEFNSGTANSSVTINVQRGAAANDLTINGALIGGTNTGNAFIFTGNGITTLNGAGTGNAGTTVNGGTVIVTSATSGGVTAVGANGTMLVAPNATLNGSVSIGGKFALIPAAGIGQIYAGGDLSMIAGGNTVMKIAKDGGSPVADNIYANILSGTGVTYGGMLTVSNITSDSTPLAVGDTFTLFSGNSFSSGFTSFNLPALPAGLSWDTSQLLASGSIVVASTAPPPVFNPGSGSYIGAQTVTISSSASGATIYYTTDGSTPTGSSPHGTAPVTVNVPANTAGLTIKAYAAATGYSANSPVVSATYSTVATPTWITPAGGSWQTAANWSNSIIANAAGVSADFSELTLPGSSTVTLASAVTVGSLNFADAGNTYGWVITPGGSSSLTLNNGTNVPVINVGNQTAIITNVALAGVNGLIKNGAGNLILVGTGSTYTSNTVVNAGTLTLSRGGASGTLTSTNITVNPGATLATTVADALGYSGSQWVRIINLYGGAFTNTSAGNEGWGLTFNMMGGTLDSGTSGGAIAAGSSTTINILATNITSKMLGKMILREGNTNGQVAFNVASGTASPDLLVNAAISQANGVWGISKSGSGIMVLTATNTYTGLTSVSNGILLVSGSITSTNIVAGGTLSGTGKLTGPTTIQAGGTLQPGLGGGNISTLTISNKLTLAGNVLMTVNRTNTQNSSSIIGISTLAYGGTLTVSNAGNVLQTGDTFTLFSATNYTGNFSTTTLPVLSSGLTWSWVPTSGTLSVVTVSTVNPNPTNIVTGVSGSALTLSWPADHTGWRLLTQTNHLESGISSNPLDWGTVSGSAATNKVIITIDPAIAGGFYRLVYP